MELIVNYGDELGSKIIIILLCCVMFLLHVCFDKV